MQKKLKRKSNVEANKNNSHILIRFNDDLLEKMRKLKDETSIEFRHMANEGMKLYFEQVR